MNGMPRWKRFTVSRKTDDAPHPQRTFLASYTCPSGRAARQLPNERLDQRSWRGALHAAQHLVAADPAGVRKAKGALPARIRENGSTVGGAVERLSSGPLGG